MASILTSVLLRLNNLDRFIAGSIVLTKHALPMISNPAFETDIHIFAGALSLSEKTKYLNTIKRNPATISTAAA